MPERLIRKLNHFAALTDDETAALRELTRVTREVAPRSVVQREGDDHNGLHLLLDSFAVRYKAIAPGSRQIVACMIPGDVCGNCGLRIGSRPNYVVSVTRILILNIINFGEIILCFGVIYAEHLHDLKGAYHQLDAYYFSIITQVTIGYGDLTPTGSLKLYAAMQGLAGLLFSILILSRLVSLLPSSETIIDKQ